MRSFARLDTNGLWENDEKVISTGSYVWVHFYHYGTYALEGHIITLQRRSESRLACCDVLETYVSK